MTAITDLTTVQVYDLEQRAGRCHPDEPVGSARELLALIRMLRDRDAGALSAAARDARVRSLAADWKNSRDIQIAAAGRLVQHALDGGNPRDLI